MQYFNAMSYDFNVAIIWIFTFQAQISIFKDPNSFYFPRFKGVFEIGYIFK